MLFSKKRVQGCRHPGSLLLIPLVVLSLTSCAKIAPRNMDVDLPAEMLEVEETSFVLTTPWPIWVIPFLNQMENAKANEQRRDSAGLG